MLDVVVATQAHSQGLSMWAQRVSLYALGTLSNVWSNHAESRVRGCACCACHCMRPCAVVSPTWCCVFIIRRRLRVMVVATQG